MEDSTNEQGDKQGLDQLQACRKELEEMTNRYKYLAAEFDNYKKRVVKEQASWAEYAQDQSLLDLVAIVDEMERALTELQSQELSQDVQSHFEGFRLILKTCQNLFTKYGVEEISHSKIFDPAVYEAVMQQESSDHESGEVVAVLQKGYQRNGRVIRPAKVSVAQ